MFLQKTGTRFKQLMKQRSGSFDEPAQAFVDNSISHSVTSPTSRHHRRDSSWLSETPSVFSTHEAADEAAAALESPKARTSRSSQSSLCSCDCGANPESIAHACHALSPASSDAQAQAHVIPPLLFGDAETWKLIFQDNNTGSRVSTSPARPSTAPGDSDVRASKSWSPTATSPKSQAKAAEAMPASDNHHLEKVEELGKSEHADTDNLSHNVEQLIKETDAAFKAVGSAIADAKTITGDWSASRKVTLQLPHRSSLTNNARPKPSALSNAPLKSPISIQTRSSTNPPALTSPALLPSPASLKSPSSAKKRAEKKKIVLLDKTAKKLSPSSPKSLAKENHARWTLMEMTANMADVFSGKIFRQDVDEMLTPERLEQIRKTASKLECRSSTESNQNDDAEGNPTKDKVRLECLVPPLSDVLARPDLHASLVPPKVPPKSKEQIQKAKPITCESVGAKKLSIVEEDADGEEGRARDKSSEVLAITGMNFPAPPCVGNPAKLSPDRSTVLPATPEDSPTTMPTSSFGTWRKCPDSPSEYINLPSTPLSLVSHPYIHGPIRIERSQFRERNDVEEEALDWTAFQVAIAGTLDDTDVWETEADEMEDLLEWWSGFGFPGCGGLVSAPRRKKTKEDMGINADQVKERRLQVPGKDQKKLQNRGEGGFSNERRDRRRPRDLKSSQLQPRGPTQSKQKRKSQFGSTVGHGQFEPYTAREVLECQETATDLKALKKQSLVSSSPSLPPSPMLDFGLLNLDKDGALDSVPMGFNLGHDLGDFLNWETYHVHNLNLDE